MKPAERYKGNPDTCAHRRFTYDVNMERMGDPATLGYEFVLAISCRCPDCNTLFRPRGVPQIAEMEDAESFARPLLCHSGDHLLIPCDAIGPCGRVTLGTQRVQGRG